MGCYIQKEKCDLGIFGESKEESKTCLRSCERSPYQKVRGKTTIKFIWGIVKLKNISESSILIRRNRSQKVVKNSRQC